jgi:hypothetical protein
LCQSRERSCKRQQRQPGIGGEGGALQRLEGLLGAVEQAGLHEVLRQRVLGAVALGPTGRAAQQVLVDAHRALVIAAAANRLPSAKCSSEVSGSLRRPR